MAAAISGFFYHRRLARPGARAARSAPTPTTSSPRCLAGGVLAALEHRRPTGEGQYIDLSQAEAVAAPAHPGPARPHGQRPDRGARGQRRPRPSPPTASTRRRGDDTWLAVAVRRATPQWAGAARTRWGAATSSPSTADARRARRASSTSSSPRGPPAATATTSCTSCRTRGVAAHVVQNSGEFAADPQLAHRGHFVEVPHAKPGHDRGRGQPLPALPHAGRHQRRRPHPRRAHVRGAPRRPRLRRRRVADLAAAELLE